MGSYAGVWATVRSGGALICRLGDLDTVPETDTRNHLRQLVLAFSRRHVREAAITSVRHADDAGLDRAFRTMTMAHGADAAIWEALLPHGGQERLCLDSLSQEASCGVAEADQDHPRQLAPDLWCAAHSRRAAQWVPGIGAAAL